MKKTYRIEDAWRFIKDCTIDLILYGILGFLAYRLLTFVDNEFIYDHRIQSSKQVREITKKYAIREKGKKDFAVLVSGSGATVSKIMGMHTNLEKAYYALRKRGYHENKIIILSNTLPYGREVNSGITGRPTPLNFYKSLDFILKNSGKDDSLTVYFTGHGKRKRRHSFLVMCNSRISEDEFYESIKMFKGKKILIFDQCYSGGFLKRLNKLPNIAIMASTKENLMAANVPDVERIFWKAVGNGEESTRAYHNAVKQAGLGHRLVINIIKIATLGNVNNYYFSFKNGNVDIAKPERKNLNEEKEDIELVKENSGIAQRTLNFFIFLFILMLIFIVKYYAPLSSKLPGFENIIYIFPVMLMIYAIAYIKITFNK